MRKKVNLYMRSCFYKLNCFIRKSSFYKMLLLVNICIVRMQFQDVCCTYNSFTILLKEFNWLFVAVWVHTQSKKCANAPNLDVLICYLYTWSPLGPGCPHGHALHSLIIIRKATGREAQFDLCSSNRELLCSLQLS